MSTDLTIGQSEVVGDNRDSAGLEVIAVNLVAQARRRAKVLQEAVEGIGEVQFSITGVDDNVVERVELATKIVVEEDLKHELLVHLYRQAELTCSVKWSLGVHEIHRGGDIFTLALSSKDNVAFVIRAT